MYINVNLPRVSDVTSAPIKLKYALISRFAVGFEVITCTSSYIYINACTTKKCLYLYLGVGIYICIDMSISQMCLIPWSAIGLEGIACTSYRCNQI
jgi:hypothetical protein